MWGAVWCNYTNENVQNLLDCTFGLAVSVSLGLVWCSGDKLLFEVQLLFALNATLAP